MDKDQVIFRQQQPEPINVSELVRRVEALEEWRNSLPSRPVNRYSHQEWQPDGFASLEWEGKIDKVYCHYLDGASEPYCWTVNVSFVTNHRIKANQRVKVTLIQEEG